MTDSDGYFHVVIPFGAGLSPLIWATQTLIDTDGLGPGAPVVRPRFTETALDFAGRLASSSTSRARP
jgi:hypothetical protein